MDMNKICIIGTLIGCIVMALKQNDHEQRINDLEVFMVQTLAKEQN